MHETLRKDPTDVSKRKPRRLCGTPANKYKIGFSLLAVGIFGTLCHFCSELSFLQPYREPLVKHFTLTESEKIQRLMMQDFFWNSSIKTLDQKLKGELEERRS